MTDFDSIYKSSINRIKSYILACQKECEPDEIFNDAYIELVGNGSEITLQNILNKAKVFIGRHDIGKPKGNNFSKQTTRVCCRCKNDVPCGFFGITTNTYTKKQIQQPYCKDCAKQYFREYFQSHRHEWNQKMKTRYKRERDDLHPNYIKKVLRVYGWQTNEITNEVCAYVKRKILETGIKIGSFKKKAA